MNTKFAIATGIVMLTGSGLSLRAGGPPQQPATPMSSHGAEQRALINRYCVSCHNEKLKTANLVLDTLDVQRVADQAEIWERVVAKLRSGAMPPAGRPRPDGATADGLTTWIEGELDRAAEARTDPGRTILHRLNRAEYTNAVRDILSLDIDGRALLPADDSGYGFDNIADVLTVSPGLLERYMSAARTVARLAVGDTTVRPNVQIFRTPKNERQEDRVTEDLPFGTRGGISVRQHFAVDGEYLFKIRFLRTVGDQEYIRGFVRQSDVDVRLDGVRVSQFSVGGQLGCPVQGLAGRGCFTPISGATGKLSESEPEIVELRLAVKAGPRAITVAFADKTLQPEGLEPRYPTAHYTFQNDIHGLTFIDTLEIAGPYNVKGPGEGSPSRRRIFVCRPPRPAGEASCAKTILTRIAERAYRRRATAADLAILMPFFETGRRDGKSFDVGIQSALVRILVSPDFLFRAERDPRNVKSAAPYRVSDVELASRLSFFLWSSVPDDALLDVAVRGQLRDPKVLAAQVRRMIADSRSSALITNFIGQWLMLRNLQAVRPDTHEFPDFDDELREAFQRETELFVDSQLREDRSVVDLLRANYTFLNERLAKHYGIPNVYGRHFRRVTLPDSTRAGLLGQASILTVTSYPNRTSPVLRGKWILENILGSPPPAPPPDVPALEEKPAVKYKSMRDRMEQHRNNPVCAGCHARIDPLGFAMENFDGTGQWRTEQGGNRIDVSGALDGAKFEGVGQLRTMLLERHQQEFIVTLTKKLLTYALGRGVEYYDMPAVRGIVRGAAPNNYRWSDIILGIVNSAPFQMRRSDT